jgi:hypothetical protein
MMNLDWSLIGKRDNYCSSNELASNNLCFHCVPNTVDNSRTTIAGINSGIGSSDNGNVSAGVGANKTYKTKPTHVGTYCYNNCTNIQCPKQSICNSKIPALPKTVFHPQTIRIPEK